MIIWEWCKHPSIKKQFRWKATFLVKLSYFLNREGNAKCEAKWWLLMDESLEESNPATKWSLPWLIFASVLFTVSSKPPSVSAVFHQFHDDVFFFPPQMNFPEQGYIWFGELLAKTEQWHVAPNTCHCCRASCTFDPSLTISPWAIFQVKGPALCTSLTVETCDSPHF